MSDTFKEKLEKYTNGTLDENERIEVEKELDKLEKYQEFIDQQNSKGQKDSKIPSPINKNYAKIISRKKWKARFQNALTVIAILLVITIVSSILSKLYYSAGKPNKIEVYRDIVQFSIATNYLNLQFRGGGLEVNSFFTANLKGDLEKRIGRENKKVGEVKETFLFNQLSMNPLNLYNNSNNEYFPLSIIEKGFYPQEWNTLDKLHEGTVAEAFLKFDGSYSTDEALNKFKDKNLDLLWLAVDTGFKKDDEYFFPDPIGFPYQPMWHQDDYTVDHREVKKESFFIKSITESASAPDVEDYGSGDLRNENFLKTLKLLQEYPKISSRASMHTIKLIVR